jgi:undecaprenyl-diphosphatase
MGFLEFLLLCVVQGITELLPISSSGHLVLVNSLVSPKPLSVSTVILLHLATAIAASLALSRTIIGILRSSVNALSGWLRRSTQSVDSAFSDISGFRLLKLLALSCLFTLLPAILVRDNIDVLFADSSLVGGALVVNGFILLTARNRVLGKKTMYKISWGTACTIGLAQSVGIIPGISRLGITLLAALICGMLWEDAVKYSFLISIPVILGGAVAEMRPGTYNPLALPLESSGWHTSIGLSVTVFVGWAAARLLLGRWGQRSLIAFALWSWGVGITALLVTILLGRM